MANCVAVVCVLSAVSAHAITFDGADLPHGTGVRDLKKARNCAARLARVEARRVEVTVRVYLDLTQADAKRGVDQFFPELTARGFSVWGWQRGRWFVEGTIAESKLRKLSRAKFVRFIDRFDDFGWTNVQDKMDPRLREALREASQNASDRRLRIRLRATLDPDGTQFAFGELAKKLASLPESCRVLEVVRPKRGVPGVIRFEAGIAWTKRVLEYLPGGPERSWAELEAIEQ